MHGCQGPCELGVCQAGYQSHGHATFLTMVQKPTQKLQQDHLKQAIHHQPVSATHVVGLLKQQIQCSCQARHLRKGQHDNGRQRSRQRMIAIPFEVNRGTGEIRAFLWRIVKLMRKRLRVKQECWLADLQAFNRLRTLVVGYHHAPPAKHMEKATARLGIEASNAAQSTGVKQMRGHIKPLQ